MSLLVDFVVQVLVHMILIALPLWTANVFGDPNDWSGFCDGDDDLDFIDDWTGRCRCRGG